MKTIFFIFSFTFFVNLLFSQNINELQKILPSDGTANDYFGDAISISGNFAAISAPWNDNINGIDAGAVYIFEFDGINWMEHSKIIASNGEYADRFGKAISLDNNRLLVGAYDYDGGNIYGQVYFYEFNGTNWVEQTTFYAPDSTSNDNFGQAVCINGDYAIIGASNNDVLGVQAGSAYIYKYNGTTWILDQQIFASDGTTQDYFGRCVFIDSSQVLVGVDFDDNTNGTNAGSVYHYFFNGSNWTEIGKIIPTDGASQDYFGKRLSVEGNHAIISSLFDDDNGAESGSAYIFEFNGTNWVQQDKITPTIGTAGENFGYDVALYGNKAVVGCHYNDNPNGVDAGAAYTFEKNGTNWEQTSILLPSDGNDSLYFGSKVAIQNKKILVACLWDNDNGIKSGSAYIFSNPRIRGKIFHDFDEDCIEDIFDVLLPERLLTIEPIGLIEQTDIYGNWTIDSLPPGTYSIYYDTSGNWIPTCSPIQSFTIANPDDFLPTQHFGVVSGSPCFSPEISVIMPAIRPCFTNQNLIIKVKNKAIATGNIENGYVDLALDSLITPTNSSIPYTSIGNNIYRFNLPVLIYPGSDYDIHLECAVSCNAILGSTLCVKANLFPVDTCVLDTLPSDVDPNFIPCTLPWDNSSISVDGWCNNDTIYFTITNTGDFGNGDMDCYSPVRLFIDGEYIWLDSIQLLGGDTDTLIFAGDGRTWRLEVDQHPLHPGNSHPNATIELCGNDSNWTSDLVNVLPMDDADPIIDIYCAVVSASYDPNDKRGFPLGVTDTHYVSRNGVMEYVIRFQNTGTDTAFTVVVRDTLDLDFNILSVVSGVSSHSYNFRMYGPRVLEWKFSNILLPDSTTNEPGSHGFITFSVQQNLNLPNGTELNNTADIYFDFNPPIITNTTSHIIKISGFQTNSIVESEIEVKNWLIYPNPTNNNITILNNNLLDERVNFLISDISGKTILSGKLNSKFTNLDLTNLDNGIYLLSLENETVKIIKQ